MVFFLGSFDRGKGGLRDSEEKIFFQFCKEVNVESTVHAELLTFREGILMTAAS